MEGVVTILFADDDRVIRNAVAGTLRQAGYRVVVAKDGLEAVGLFGREHPELVLLDVGMPKMNGRQVCENIRRVDESVPILLYTAFDEDADQIAGLDCGADDFISKDASTDVLQARVATALRRRQRSEIGNFAWGEGHVDVASQCYVEGTRKSELTVREIEFLRHLALNEGSVISKDALVTRLFGADYLGDPRALDKMIERVRRKLFGSARLLATIPRQGVRYTHA